MTPHLKHFFSFGGPLDLFSKSQQAPPVDEDSKWMKEALKEAVLATGISNPNPAVGCILVDRNGKEISRGHTQAYRGFHAERSAFERVQDLNRLDGATAYVTLEPCSHSGHQPPCVDLLTRSKIKKVVIAAQDPFPQVNGNGISKLKQAGKEVLVGLFHHEAVAWNYSFFAAQSLKRPVFVLKWAQTLDGQLADDQNNSKWITGHAARSYTHWLRQRYDAILVGARTVLADYPKLSARDCPPPHQHQPLPIIVDPNGLCFGVNRKIQSLLSEATFHPSRPFVLITTPKQMKQNKNSWIFKKTHGIFLQNSERGFFSNLPKLVSSQPVIESLGRPLQSVFIEGGAKTLTTLLHLGLADLLHVFVAPTITGGEKNRTQLMLPLKKAQTYCSVASFQLDQDVVIEMIPKNLAKIFS